MAVDTQTKRRSVLGMTLSFLVIAPLPDGTIANVDRMHATALYGGIVPVEPPTDVFKTNDLYNYDWNDQYGQSYAVSDTVLVNNNELLSTGLNDLYSRINEQYGPL